MFLKASRGIPSSLLLFMLLPVFLPFGTPLSFNFPLFNESTPDLLKFEGDAFWNNQSIQLSKTDIGSMEQSSGSAVYRQPLLLWDSVTRNVTDFTTHFSFLINASTYSTSPCSDNCSGDGLAFFLAPYPHSFPKNSSGGVLGLFSDDSGLNTSKNRLVAVEFDTYLNYWDPSTYHVGIDVNSIKSAAYVNCSRGITRGRVSNATITYSSSTQSLSVHLTYNANEDDPYSSELLSISHVVDLGAILPREVAVGFSAATGGSVELHQILSWDFSSAQVASVPPPPQPVNNTRSSGDEKGDGSQLLIGVPSGVGVVVIACGILWFILWHKKAKKHRNDEGRGPRRFSFNELAAATNNFAEEGKLGEGGFGNVYRGLLNGVEVAIKRVKADSTQGEKEYLAEVSIISQVRHRNLVQLIGWCDEKGEFLLAYKYMPKGSLDSHLYGRNNLLEWKTRYEIAKNLASALLYLHEECEQCVVHRDIKPSNVMLDSAFNAKLGDFGLARLVDHELDAKTTVQAGTPGYMAPENAQVSRARATKESDVYSFGVVALQLASGRIAIGLVDWVWGLYGEGIILKAADEKLGMEFDEEEMLCLLLVGLWCAHPYRSQRPSIRRAFAVLNREAPCPNLPCEMPNLLPRRVGLNQDMALAEDSVGAENSASVGFTASSSSLSIMSGYSEVNLNKKCSIH